MRKKTIIFIVVILVLLVIGVFAGWKFVAAGGGFVGLVGTIFASRALKHDGRANNSGIDGQLKQEGSLNKATGNSLSERQGGLDTRSSGIEERQGIIDQRSGSIENRQSDLGEQKATLDRDRDLLEELQKRHPEG